MLRSMRVKERPKCEEDLLMLKNIQVNKHVIRRKHDPDNKQKELHQWKKVECLTDEVE